MAGWEHAQIFANHIDNNPNPVFGSPHYRADVIVRYFDTEGARGEVIHSHDEKIAGHYLDKALSKMGTDGWELVSVVGPPSYEQSNNTGYRIWFKRPKP